MIMNLTYFLLLIPYILIFLAYRLKHKLYTKIIGYVFLILLIIYFYSSSLIDKLSLIYGLCASYIALFVSIYTSYYVNRKNYPQYTELLIDLFSLSMINAFLSPNILGLVIAWSIAEIVGFLLVSIGEKHSIEGSTRSSSIFLFLSALTFELSVFTTIYISVFIMTALIVSYTGFFNLRPLTEPFWILSEYRLVVPEYIVLILVIGFITKSALVPLHFWLPSAHTVAPSPASALLSGVMTAMGIYGLLRINMFIDLSYMFLINTLIVLSIISIIYGGLQAIVQRDGKKLLAYSTIVGNGVAISLLAFYLYTMDDTVLAILVIAVMAHMSYKATLFLDIGVIEELTGFRYLHKLRGLVNLAPISVLGGILAFLSLIGFPPTTGFTSKLFSILILVSKINDPVSTGVFLSVLLYIIFSIMIGLHYVKTYFGETSSVFNVSKVDVKQQYCVLFIGLSNILFTLVLLLFTGFTGYVLVYSLASPLMLIFVYLVNNVMRRG